MRAAITAFMVLQLLFAYLLMVGSSGQGGLLSGPVRVAVLLLADCIAAMGFCNFLRTRAAVSQLSFAARGLAHGAQRIEIPGQDRQDDIGQIATSLATIAADRSADSKRHATRPSPGLPSA